MDQLDYLLRMIGGTLVQLQRVEYVIRACFACMPQLGGIHIEPEDLLTTDSATRKYTLGQMLTALRSKIPLGDLDHRLARFVRDRNTFTHSYFVDFTFKLPLSDSDYASLTSFVVELGTEALEIEQIFHGLFAEVVNVAFEKYGLDLCASHPELRSFLQKRDLFYAATGIKDA